MLLLILLGEDRGLGAAGCTVIRYQVLLQAVLALIPRRDVERGRLQ